MKAKRKSNKQRKLRHKNVSLGGCVRGILIPLRSNPSNYLVCNVCSQHISRELVIARGFEYPWKGETEDACKQKTK